MRWVKANERIWEYGKPTVVKYHGQISIHEYHNVLRCIPIGDIEWLDMEITNWKILSIPPNSGDLKPATPPKEDTEKEQAEFYYKMGTKCEKISNQMKAYSSTKEEDELWNSVVARVAAADVCKSTTPGDVEGIQKWKLKVVTKLKQSFIISKRGV